MDRAVDQQTQRTERLEEHSRRVEAAQRKLREDVEQLSLTSHRIKRRTTRLALGWAFAGGSALCAVLALRAVYRRVTVGVQSSSRLGRSLCRAALKSLAAEILRNLCVRAVMRAFPVEPRVHQLPPDRAAARRPDGSPFGFGAAQGSRSERDG